MINLLLRTSFLWSTHFATYAFYTVMMPVAGKPEALLFCPLLLPVWVVSAVGFGEREERYAFLRTLPLTDRQIVLVKLGVALAAIFCFLGLLVLVGLAFLGGTPDFAVQLKLVALCGAFCLLLAGGGYLASWRFGSVAWTALIVALAPLTLFFLAVIKPVKDGLRFGARTHPLFQTVAGIPGWSLAVLLLLVLAVYLALVRAGILVKERSDACL